MRMGWSPYQSLFIACPPFIRKELPSKRNSKHRIPFPKHGALAALHYRLVRNKSERVKQMDQPNSVEQGRSRGYVAIPMIFRANPTNSCALK
jgi:hypothetical protein